MSSGAATKVFLFPDKRTDEGYAEYLRHWFAGKKLRAEMAVAGRVLVQSGKYRIESDNPDDAA